jgi:drug/metabolite transporter (DMT)-like permease
MEVSGKFISNALHPLQINFLRFLIGGLILLPFAISNIKAAGTKPSAKDIWAMAGLGILLVPISMTLFQFSIFYTKASITAVLISCNAIFTAPLSYLLLKEKMDKYIILSLVSGLAGIIIIALPNSSLSTNDLIGIGLGIASSITFSLFSVLGKKIISKVGGLMLNTMAFIFGSLAMIPILLLLNVPLFNSLNQFSLFYILYIGIVVTALAYILMFKGFAVLPMNAGSLVFFGKPVFAGILSYILLKETFSINFLFGSMLIMVGILFIVARKDSKLGDAIK